MKKGIYNDIDWIIHFQDNKPVQLEASPTNNKNVPPIELVISDDQSGKKTGWSSGNPDAQIEALKSLEEIVEACKEIRENCMETLSHQEKQDLDDQVTEVSKNLKSLFQLIIEFTKIMKKFNRGENEDKGNK